MSNKNPNSGGEEVRARVGWLMVVSIGLGVWGATDAIGRGRQTRRIEMKAVRIALGILFVLALVTVAGAAGTRDATKGWGALNGWVLSAVVWSPDGRNIAFIATKHDPRSERETNSSIWVLPVGKVAGSPQLLHTVEVDPKTQKGLPVGLFWLTRSKLVWGDFNNRFHCVDMCGQTGDFLGAENIRKSLSYWVEDVYFNRRSRELIVTTVLADPSYDAAILLDTRTGKARQAGLRPKPGHKTTMSSWTSPYRTRGSYRHYYYISGVTYGADRGMKLWRASGSPSKRVRLLATQEVKDSSYERELFFPRPSPDGRRLLWMGVADPPRTGRVDYNKDWNIWLFNIRSRTKRVIGHIPDARYWQNAISPGCPFSWSPKGDRVAYAYGDRIRIVRVR